MSIVDASAEGVAAVLARTGRALLISAGTLAGVAALVATLGLASTARAQITDTFNRYAATEVTVVPTDDRAGTAIPTDAGALAHRVHGVLHAGRFWSIGNDLPPIRSSWTGGEQSPAGVYAADVSTLDVIEPHLIAGRRINDFDISHAIPSIMLSRSIARQLGIRNVAPPNYVFIGTGSFLVVGVYDRVNREPATLLGAIVSIRTAQSSLTRGTADSPSVIVSTRAGSAAVVATQLPVALRVDNPAALRGQTQENSTALRGSIDDAVRKLLLVLAAVAIVVGALSIANGTLVSVIERIPEIGLRRALGARRLDIAVQFVVEGAITGTLGGVLGFGVGVSVVVGFSEVNHWTPTMDLITAAVTPVAGTATGLLAAIYPALRACSVPASLALRQ